MARDLDLKRRLEAAGLTVVEVDGWQSRGSANFDPRGSVNHHTAGPRTGVAPSLGVILNGRPDLPGPLANTYGARVERYEVYLVAAGRANHAGSGTFRGLMGNSSVLGHEEEHSGRADEPFSELRMDRAARIHAAFMWGKQTTSDYVCQHHEWTSRKIDFVRDLMNPVEFRIRVQVHLNRLIKDGYSPLPGEEPDPPVAVVPTGNRRFILL